MFEGLHMQKKTVSVSLFRIILAVVAEFYTLVGDSHSGGTSDLFPI